MKTATIAFAASAVVILGLGATWLSISARQSEQAETQVRLYFLALQKPLTKLPMHLNWGSSVLTLSQWLLGPSPTT